MFLSYATAFDFTPGINLNLSVHSCFSSIWPAIRPISLQLSSGWKQNDFDSGRLRHRFFARGLHRSNVALFCISCANVLNPCCIVFCKTAYFALHFHLAFDFIVAEFALLVSPARPVSVCRYRSPILLGHSGFVYWQPMRQLQVNIWVTLLKLLKKRLLRYWQAASLPLGFLLPYLSCKFMFLFISSQERIKFDGRKHQRFSQFVAVSQTNRWTRTKLRIALRRVAWRLLWANCQCVYALLPIAVAFWCPGWDVACCYDSQLQWAFVKCENGLSCVIV